MKLNSLLVALLGCSIVSAPLLAQAPDKPTLSSITLNSGSNLIGEVRSENAVSVVFFDLNSGEDKTIQKADIKTKLSATDAVAIGRVGLPRFLAWRIGKELNAPATGKIAEVTPSAIYLTLGEKDGIVVGKSLSVFRDEGEIKDPDTGNVIGRKRSKLAKLEVIEVKDSYSKAKRLGDLEVELKVGDLVEQDGVNQAVAIMPILDVNGDETTAGKTLAEQLATVFVNRGIAVVERSRLDTTLQELALQQNKVFDQDAAQKVGKQLGAFAVLTGTITPKGTRAEAFVRLTRVQTGEIVVAASQDVAAGTAVKSGPQNPVKPKALPLARQKPTTFLFTSEKEIAKSWILPTGNDAWVFLNGAFLQKSGDYTSSRFSIKGDCEIGFDISTPYVLKVIIFGEKFGLEGGGDNKRCLIIRRGNQISVNVNGSATYYTVKEANLDQESTIQMAPGVAYTGGRGIKGAFYRRIDVKAQELIMPPDQP